MIIQNLMYPGNIAESPSASPLVEKYQRIHSIGHYHILANHPDKLANIELDSEKDYLIFLIRNYRESMLRHFLEDVDRVVAHLENDSKDHYVLKYFENLKVYDEWPSSRKLLVYYEDLVQKPAEAISKIASFLQIEEGVVDNFIDHFENLNKNTLTQYNEQIGTSEKSSGGKDILSHSKGVELYNLIEMDSLAKKRAGALYDKYLKRYDLLKFPVSLEIE